MFEERILGRLPGPHKDEPTTGYRKLQKWGPNWIIII
jgi:hypothetical protein